MYNSYCSDFSVPPDDISQIYPVDERLWLLGTAYNTGIECLQYVLGFLIVTHFDHVFTAPRKSTKQNGGSSPVPLYVAMYPTVRLVQKR